MPDAGGTDRAALPAPRSVLFYPAHRTEMLEKALASGADAVCLDLEDAVPPDRKAAAREATVAALERAGGDGRVELFVRVNGPGSEEGRRDLTALAGAPGTPAAVVVPGADAPGPLSRVADRAGTRVVALVESPRGLAAVEAVAREVESLRALALGPVDLSRELGCELAWEPLLYARSRLVHAAALGDVPVLDGPYTDLSDAAGLAEEARSARRMGFDGKLALHPRQVEPVNRAFTPTESETAEARKIVHAFEESGGETVRVGGRMVDRPVAEAARRTLLRARRAGGAARDGGSDESDGEGRDG